MLHVAGFAPEESDAQRAPVAHLELSAECECLATRMNYDCQAISPTRSDDKVVDGASMHLAAVCAAL